jgi:hypothetical protein
MSRAFSRICLEILGILLAGILLPRAVGVSPLRAQGPADLGPREKTELFIQHIVKVSRVDPAKYQSLVLEYEIGRALEELAHDHKEGEECASCQGGKSPVSEKLTADFVERALREIHPSYSSLVALIDAGKLGEAKEAGTRLLGSSDPYLSAHAALALAEIGFQSAAGDGLVGELTAPAKAAYEHVLRSCETMVQKDRLYLIKDHRACELIALCFEKLKKPLLEFIQYAILLTDYNDLPADVEGRAKARLAALEEEAGRPLGTVANWMSQVEKLLGQELTSVDPTQAKETEIVSALDKLIELQEARERRT